MAKVLCVLYDDPTSGYPPKYARNDIPEIEKYPDGQTVPNPKHIDFVPGELLGCVSGELGLRSYLEDLGHTFIVTSDKDGPDSVFEKELSDADIVISPPFTRDSGMLVREPTDPRRLPDRFEWKTRRNRSQILRCW